ncbi:MAG: hypothetical protein H6773_04485 [Pseudomonadales bacterium]|nr:hypothetical protein [Pseudomonadales bacterium]
MLTMKIPEAMLLMLVGDADNDGLIEQAEAEVEAADTYVDSMKQQQKNTFLKGIGIVLKSVRMNSELK